MSYIFNNSVKYSDTINLDAFGRLRVSEVSNLIELKHIYDKQPLLVNEVTGGTVTSVHSQEYARVRMSTSTATSYVIRQSKIWPVYEPGKSQIFEASFSNFQIESNVIKRVGLFNSTTAATYNTLLDGIYLESNGQTSQISFFIKRSGTTVYSAVSTTWNSTEYDPSSIDWSKTQIMFVDYQWLGVGRVRFGLTIDGITYVFSEHSSTNSETEVYMSNSNQPIRYEIRQEGVGSGSFDMICSQISSEGSINDLFLSTSIPYTATTTLSTSGTKYPYIGVRLKPQFRSVNSYIKDSLILNTSNDNYLVTIEYNPTLSSSPTWIDLDGTPFQYVLDTGTRTVTTSGFIVSSTIGEAGTSALTEINVQDNQVKMGTNINGSVDEMWVCITPLGANATFNSTLNIAYEI